MPVTAAKNKTEILDPAAEFLTSLPEKFTDLGQAFDEKVRATKHAFNDSVKLTKRTVKHVRATAEQISEDAVHTIKKHPIPAVLITFGAAVTIGMLGGLVMRRTGRAR